MSPFIRASIKSDWNGRGFDCSTMGGEGDGGRRGMGVGGGWMGVGGGWG